MPSFSAPPSCVTAASEVLLYSSPSYPTCASASQCVAACTPISTRSSLVVKSAGSPVKGALAMIIVRFGLMRPGITPVCGPSSSYGIDSEKLTPRRTAATPRRTASGVMKLSVPRWSSSPHRPQFETRFASCFSSSGRGTLSSLSPFGVNYPRMTWVADAKALLRGVLLTELVLQDLAGRVARQHVDDLELLGDLLGHQPRPRAEVEDVLEVRWRLLVGGDDDRAPPLPRRVVLQPDHGDVADPGGREQHVLDLLCADRLTLADDHVLEPAGDRDVAVGVLEAEIAGTEPPVVVERVRVERRVDVPAEEHRALDPDLTLLARLRHRLVEPDDLHLDAGRCAALGLGQLHVRVLDRRHRQDGAFGEPVSRHDADA